MCSGYVDDAKCSEATIAEVGWEMFQLMLDVAFGRETFAEKWKLHNALVLFNPAPVT